MRVEIFLILSMPRNFGLYLRYFDYYVVRFWVLFKYVGNVDIFVSADNQAG